jgi:hypothetical protein
MKNFSLGFFVCLSLSLGTYLAWESYRHVPILIKQVPVPIFTPSPGSPLKVPPPPMTDGSVAKNFYS